MPPGEEKPGAQGALVERGRHGLLRSFAFAWAGLAEGAVRDRNLRIHLGLGVLASAVAARAPLEPAERALLLACVAVVVAAECMNSAVEAAVDLASPAWHERARLAKDAAAGAVLAVAAGSVLVAVVVVGPRVGAFLASGQRVGLQVAAAIVAAFSSALLPGPRPPSRAKARTIDWQLAVGAVLGVAVVAYGAASQAGSVAAALCVAIAIGGAARRGKLPA